MTHQSRARPSRWRHLRGAQPSGQFLRPASDALISNFTAEGGPSTCYECLDEERPSDADYIEGTAAADFARMGLSAGVDPQSSKGHVLRWRWRAVGTGAAETADVHLLQGSSTVVAFVVYGAAVPRSWATDTYALSPTEVSQITDYTTLQVRFRIAEIGTSEAIQVSWCELELPPAPSG